MTRDVRAYVALGSNLGDRAAHLASALAALDATPGVRVAARSATYETAPVGPPGQGPYLNAVAALDTALAPRALLARLHAIERAAGRERTGTRNEARTLDLDLLFYGDAVLAEPDCRVPHGLRHPLLGRTAAELAAALAWNEAEVRRLD
jgi:2-amino-4-hydroxy-6-hydroxymethyldihydropteridine diphosphokinase